MLGLDRLFEEEEAPVYGPQNRPTHQGTKSTQCSGPPDPRSESRLCGINNQGATCYLNALLQTLLYTPEFREALFSLGPDELGCLEDRDKPHSKVRVIPIQLQLLFSRLLLLDQSAVSTVQLTDSFGWTGSEEFQQHDVQELNRILFSAIDASLVGTSGEQLISNLYKGSIVNQITCEECGRVSERKEDFFDLTAAVANLSSLEEYFTSCYIETERFEGRNQYRCEVCNKLVNATQGAKLGSLPPILSISLLRFSFDYVKLQRYKENGKYTFPMDLDLRSYCDKEETVDTAIYELFSVVIHRGSCYGGHYHAYIKDVDNLGKWHTPIEEYTVIPPKPKLESHDTIDFSSPMECLCRILAEHGGPEFSMGIDKLCQALIEDTGVSWNKQYKKQYGTVTKFLRKYNDLFSVDACSNTVSLHSTEHEDDNAEKRGEVIEKSKDEKQGIVAAGDNQLNITQSKLLKKTPMCNTQGDAHWFDFNDAHVRPINQNQITMQFSGRESAYMLFYRRKSLQRPKGAQGTPNYSLPQHITDELSRLNSDLTAMRRKHELEINAITLSILQSPHYEYSCGRLRTTSNNCVISLQIDQRKTVQELLNATQEAVGHSAQESHLSIAKELPAGIHLYKMISGDTSRIINDCDLDNGSQLFLWDGKTVGGLGVRTGVEAEPILLNITYFDACGIQREITYAFAKDALFGKVRLMISKLTEIEPTYLLISRVRSKHVMAASDNQKTLQELTFLDCDSISAQAKTRTSKAVFAQAVLERQQKLVKIQVENRCVSNTPEQDWPLIVVETELNQTIDKLKSVILQKLGLVEKPDGAGRLRKCNETHGCQPPLYEQQSLEAAEINDNSYLIFEPGAPPKHNQITVSYTFRMCANTNNRKEIIVNKTMTVGKCLRVLLMNLDLKGNMYHLQKTNWQREPSEVMDDVDASLDQENVKNGDHLIVQDGKLPPRGFVSLPIWLYSLPNILETESEPGLLCWITTTMKALFNSVSDHHKVDMIKPEHIFLGNVEVSHDASIDTLKTLIMKLKHLADITIPSTHFLRLRAVEHGVLTRVFRSSEQSLRRQKVSAASKLGVQLLPEEEHLKQNTIVLAICRRMVQSRTYSVCQELIWDTTRSQAPEALKQAIADRLQIPIQRIIVAKHQLEKYSWVVIPDSLQHSQKKGQKGKKKGGHNQKLNLKHAPYQLKDGDVIGVMDLEDDPEKNDNFCTEDDDIGKEKLKQIADEKRKMRKEFKENDVGCISKEKKKDKRKEVALVIRVDDFK